MYLRSLLWQATRKNCSTVLWLVEVKDTTAEALYRHVEDFFFITVGIDVNDCNASNMVGKNNSLCTLLTKNLPNFLLFKCVCHSLQLVCLYAAEELAS